MSFINIEQLITLLAQYQDQKLLFQTFSNINKDCRLYLKTFPPLKTIEIANQINLRLSSYSKNPKKQMVFKHINWQFGQFQIFVWIIVYKCLVYNVKFQEFTEEIYTQIQRILHSRAITFLRYQVRVLINFYSKDADVWSEEQTSILQAIIRQHPPNEQFNWKLVSYYLYSRSNCQYFKHLNLCREKWYNHLNPQLKRGKWSEQQDLKLFKLILKLGFKWAQISRKMNQQRTQHMVKNRYNHYLQKWQIKKKFNPQVEELFIEVLKKFNYSALLKKGVNINLTKKQEKPMILQEQSQALSCKLQIKEQFCQPAQDYLINIKLQQDSENEVVNIKRKGFKVISYSSFTESQKTQNKQNDNNKCKLAHFEKESS